MKSLRSGDQKNSYLLSVLLGSWLGGCGQNHAEPADGHLQNLWGKFTCCLWIWVTGDKATLHVLGFMLMVNFHILYFQWYWEIGHLSVFDRKL